MAGVRRAEVAVGELGKRDRSRTGAAASPCRGRQSSAVKPQWEQRLGRSEGRWLRADVFLEEDKPHLFPFLLFSQCHSLPSQSLLGRGRWGCGAVGPPQQRARLCPPQLTPLPAL